MSSGIALMVSPTAATAAQDTVTSQVCQPLDSGKIDVQGNHETIQATAPDGMLIDGYCVKAGSQQQGNGPVYRDVAPPQKTVTISYPGGKDISHYSLSYVEVEVGLATADVTFVDPSCDNGNEARLVKTGEHVTWIVLGDVSPGHFVTVKATADRGYEFADGKSSKTWAHRYGQVQDCTLYDAAAAVSWVEPTCENGNTVDYVKSTDENIKMWKEFGSWEPGGTVKVIAFAASGHKFPGEPPSHFKVFKHTFEMAQVNCTVVTPVAPTFVEPTCTTAPAAQAPVSELVKYEVTGSLVAGGTVHVTASLVDSETTHWAPGVTTSWDYTFVVPTGCTIVSPPVVEPPVVESTTEAEAPEAVTPTVVHAGLAGTTSSSTEQQGLALLLTGLLLMAGAGGLVVVKGGERR